jgi:hypothetical protein
MKKLFLLLAIASVALTSCVERVDPRISALSMMTADTDSIVVFDKCVVESCTKIVADTFNCVDCNGNITKQYDLDTIKVPACNYVFYKKIGKTKIEKTAVEKNVFDSTRKGDTTSLYKLWYASLEINTHERLITIGDGTLTN